MLADHAAIPVLAVTDLDRAREFYEGTLGFTSGPEVPDGVRPADNTCWVTTVRRTVTREGAG